MAKSATIMLAGGGTGGHVYPGLALAEALVALQPEVRIVWVGSSDRMEARVVPAAGHPFEPLTLGFLKGTSGMKRLSSLAKLPLAAVRVLQLFARYRPAAVVGLGGYVAGPPCLIGALLGRPVFLLEQNAIPGRTNRFLARFCRRVFATFAQASAYFPAGRVEVAGNPLRGAVLEVAARGRTTAPDGPLRLLVVGGSQGARSLNEGLPQVFGLLRKAGVSLSITHVSGSGAADKVRRAYEAAGAEATVVEYVDGMAATYAQTDLVVCRAGATTISELTAIGLPAVYLPFPAAADDHQTHNARAVVEAGGGLMVTDAALLADPAAFAAQLRTLVEDRAALSVMGANARTIGRPEAAREVARAILTAIGLPAKEQP